MSRAGSETFGKKFLPAFFVDVVEKGEEFAPSEWPAHITLFPPIQQPYDLGFGKVMREWAGPISPFTVEVGEEAVFDGANPEEGIPVRLIEDETGWLQRVHEGLLQTCASMLYDPTYRQPYNPHVSHPARWNIQRGRHISIGGFAIAARYDEVWRVVDKIGFKGSKQNA